MGAQERFGGEGQDVSNLTTEREGDVVRRGERIFGRSLGFEVEGRSGGSWFSFVSVTANEKCGSAGKSMSSEGGSECKFTGLEGAEVGDE